MNSDEYVKDGGQHCPACGSDDIMGNRGSLDYGTGSVFLWPECGKCGSRWQEVYRLESYDQLEKY